MLNVQQVGWSLGLLMLWGPTAATRDCAFALDSDRDFEGGDLDGQPASKALSTPAECAALCCSVGSPCAAFSLNAGTAGSRWCYLKGAGGWVNQSSPGCESGVLSTPPPPGPLPMWFNVSHPRADRVTALLAAMTLPEKIGALNDASPAIPRLSMPAYSWESEASHGVSWAGVATVFSSPISWGASFDPEMVHAVAEVIAIEARAKWRDGRASDGSSSEFFGLDVMAPNNNLFLDPRWGRGQETNGEDPVLTSALTAAFIRGMQFGSDPAYLKTIATSKHYLGYHLESSLTDDQYRLSHSFNYSETDVQQYYLQPFIAAVNANVSSVMCAYDGANSTNPAWPYPGGKETWGVPLCLHPNMATLLRGQLQFKGYVISDEGAVTFAGPGYHDYAPLTDAACLAINAGTDLCLGGEFASTLGDCIARGNVSLARIDEALTRLLNGLMDLGWFDTLGARMQSLPDPVSYNNVSVQHNVSSPEHRLLSRRASQAGMVLLKNDGGILPLDPAKLQRVALVGPTASYDNSSTGSYIGNYPGCVDGPGGALTNDPACHVVTLLEALSTAAAVHGFSLGFAEGCDVNTPNSTAGFPAAIQAASGAQVIFAALGLDTCQESACSEGEANDRRTGLDLPGSQLELLRALHEAYPSTPIVLVMLNGGPISSPYGYSAASAVVEAWYPGYEGGNAIVSLLWGEASPAGRLPITILRNDSLLPPITDTVLSTPPGRTHMYFTGAALADVLYPFGFGLSYATLTYSNLSITPPLLTPGDPDFTVAALVSHSAGPACDEVVQVYGSFNARSTGLASYPLQQLLGFTRLRGVSPGAVIPVSFTLPRSALELVSPAGDMGVAPGNWTIWLGGGPPSNVAYGGGAVLQGALPVVSS